MFPIFAAVPPRGLRGQGLGALQGRPAASMRHAGRACEINARRILGERQISDQAGLSAGQIRCVGIPGDGLEGAYGALALGGDSGWGNPERAREDEDGSANRAPDHTGMDKATSPRNQSWS